MEILGIFAILVIGGIFLAFVAVAGLLLVSFVKLIFLPVTVAFEAVKWVVLVVVVPIIVFVVIPIVLLVLVPFVLLFLVPVMFGLAILACPLLLLATAT